MAERSRMVLITGGCGYLGWHLARALLARGEQVRIFDRARLTVHSEGVEFRRGDIRDGAACKEAAIGCGVIFHLVGLMPQARAPESLMREVNVDGTRNMLDAAVHAGTKRFVFLSSMEVYGRPARIPMREDDPANPIGEYGRNKLEAERLCSEYAGKHGLSVASLRPSTLVGANMTDPQMLSLLRWMRRKLPLIALSNGNNRFQMTSLKDCISACLLSTDKDAAAGKIFNIGADDPPKVLDLIRDVAERTGNPFPVIPIPPGPVKTALRLLERLGISPIPPDHFELLDATHVMDCSRAKDLLGWKPTQSNADMIMEAMASFSR